MLGGAPPPHPGSHNSTFCRSKGEGAVTPGSPSLSPAAEGTRFLYPQPDHPRNIPLRQSSESSLEGQAPGWFTRTTLSARLCLRDPGGHSARLDPSPILPGHRVASVSRVATRHTEGRAEAGERPRLSWAGSLSHSRSWPASHPASEYTCFYAHCMAIATCGCLSIGSPELFQHPSGTSPKQRGGTEGDIW